MASAFAGVLLAFAFLAMIVALPAIVIFAFRHALDEDEPTPVGGSRARSNGIGVPERILNNAGGQFVLWRDEDAMPLACDADRRHYDWRAGHLAFYTLVPLAPHAGVIHLPCVGPASGVLLDEEPRKPYDHSPEPLLHLVGA